MIFKKPKFFGQLTHHYFLKKGLLLCLCGTDFCSSTDCCCASSNNNISTAGEPPTTSTTAQISKSEPYGANGLPEDVVQVQLEAVIEDHQKKKSEKSAI